jgi:hypothetical protein
MSVDYMHPEDLAKRANDLHTEALFEGDAPILLSPMAEQYYLLAINALEQAERFARLAHYNLMQGK